ncbi:hypothetical protein EXIGLDRAFT_732772 [Exidia glandulosa HHB12029]|uniref:Uncharacterized protein n=1 Tax=Exidia glandulosa HHB12029 TaxID=1314781 RepID=A0A165BEH4_EXIGL|nr:hypothetical protein EXIGLDRAFT_732772 [Exidia glandulosa HHB12029]
MVLCGAFGRFFPLGARNRGSSRTTTPMHSADSAPMHSVDEPEKHEPPVAGEGVVCDAEVNEWREGPHLVIERRRSDMDVEVEVIRNAFREEGSGNVARFAGARDKVMRDVHAHLDSLGHRVEGALGIHRSSPTKQ